jgi:hypothetical protein
VQNVFGDLTVECVVGLELEVKQPVSVTRISSIPRVSVRGCPKVDAATIVAGLPGLGRRGSTGQFKQYI